MFTNVALEEGCNEPWSSPASQGWAIQPGSVHWLVGGGTGSLGTAGDHRGSLGTAGDRRGPLGYTGTVGVAGPRPGAEAAGRSVSSEFVAPPRYRGDGLGVQIKRFMDTLPQYMYAAGILATGQTHHTEDPSCAPAARPCARQS